MPLLAALKRLTACADSAGPVPTRGGMRGGAPAPRWAAACVREHVRHATPLGNQVEPHVVLLGELGGLQQFSLFFNLMVCTHLSALPCRALSCR